MLRPADSRAARAWRLVPLALLACLLTCPCAAQSNDVWRPDVKLPAIGGEFAAPASLPPDAALLPASIPTPPLDDHPYDLAELIDLAESINPETRAAWNAARDAALTVGLARSVYLPQLSAAALAGHQSASGRTSDDAIGIGGDSRYDGTVAALSLQWLLFDFGRRSAVLDVARQSVVTAQLSFNASHQRLLHRVSVAFYAYSAARLSETSSGQSLQDATSIQKAADERYRRGVGTIVETAQARQAVAQATLEHIRAQGRRENAYVALLAAVGLSPLAKIDIADATDHPLGSALAGDVDRAIAAAMTRRPDVLTAYSALQASQASIRLAKADYRPRVFLFASTSHTDGDLSISGLPAATPNEAPTLNLTHRSDGFSVMGLLSVPLFDGGRRRTALSQANVRADTARALFDQTRIEAVRQIVDANNQLRTSLEAHRAATELVAAAQTTFDATLAAYRHGVGSATDTFVAERQLLEAKTASADAFSAALAAAATLALATGELDSAR